MTKKLLLICFIILLATACSNGDADNESSNSIVWEEADNGGKTLDGVIFETQFDEYVEGTQEIIGIWTNTLDDSMLFGHTFALEKKVDGIWRKVTKVTDIEYAFTNEGIILEANGTKEEKYWLEPFTDNLTSGEYRINTTFSRETLNGVDYDPGNHPEYQVYGYFTVGSNVNKSIDSSDIFTKEDITAAMNIVMDYFNENFRGCDLVYLSYDESISLPSSPEWAAQYGADEAIVFVSSFDVDENGGDGSLNPNSTYEDWLWILTRSSKSNWTLQTWGY